VAAVLRSFLLRAISAFFAYLKSLLGLGPTVDPRVREIERAMEEWRRRVEAIQQHLASESAAIIADFDRSLAALNDTGYSAPAPESSAPSFAARYLAHLIQAHQLDPQGTEQLQLSPDEFELRFESDLHVQIGTKIRERLVAADSLRKDVNELESRAADFGVAAEGLGNEVQSRWREAAKHAAAEVAKATLAADRALVLGPPDSAPFHDGSTVGISEDLPAEVSRALAAARSELDGSRAVSSAEAEFTERLRGSIQAAFRKGLDRARRRYEGEYLPAFKKCDEAETDWAKVKAQIEAGGRIRYADVPLVVRENDLWREMARNAARLFVDDVGEVWLRGGLRTGAPTK
jgi:hypothetical protein